MRAVVIKNAGGSMKKYDKDKKLEQHIIDFLYEECNLSSIVTDCLNYHADDPNHIALKKRNLLEFKNDFGEASGKCIVSLKEISNCLSIKDYSKDHLAAHLFFRQLRTAILYTEFQTGRLSG